MGLLGVAATGVAAGGLAPVRLQVRRWRRRVLRWLVVPPAAVGVAHVRALQLVVVARVEEAAAGIVHAGSSGESWIRVM